MGLFISGSACLLDIVRFYGRGCLPGFSCKVWICQPTSLLCCKKGILSKRGLHVLIHLHGCFTDTAYDRTMADLVFSSIFNVWKGSYLYLPVSGKNITAFNFRYTCTRAILYLPRIPTSNCKLIEHISYTVYLWILMFDNGCHSLDWAGFYVAHLHIK